MGGYYRVAELALDSGREMSPGFDSDGLGFSLPQRLALQSTAQSESPSNAANEAVRHVVPVAGIRSPVLKGHSGPHIPPQSPR